MTKFEIWLEQVKAILAGNYSRASELYSFRSAWEDGLSPKGAVKDFHG